VKWIKNGKIHVATDDEYNAYGYDKSIDNFLSDAFSRISEAYKNNNCPVILFDLRQNGLNVFDSPYGLELNVDTENVMTALSNDYFNSYCDGYIDGVANLFGNNSSEYKTAITYIDNLTWSAVKASISGGKSKLSLDNFEKNPILIGIKEGNDALAHDLVTGDRVELLGSPIEKESLEKCQCVYCQ